MSFYLSSGQWSLLTRPPVSGRPYKTRKPLPLYPHALLTLYATRFALHPLSVLSRLSLAVSSSHRPPRSHFVVVVVTNCLRSSAMSCELNQSAECPDAPDAGKRYTGPESGQRYLCRESRANRRLLMLRRRLRSAGYLQRYDSAWRIPGVPSKQHDRTMTFPRQRNGFAFSAKAEKFEVRCAALPPSSCAHSNFFEHYLHVTVAERAAELVRKRRALERRPASPDGGRTNEKIRPRGRIFFPQAR